MSMCNLLPHAVLASIDSTWSRWLMSAGMDSLIFMTPVVFFMWVWRGGSGAVRHCIWLASISCLAVLPLASTIMPEKMVPAWSSRLHAAANNVVDVSFLADSGLKTAARRPGEAITQKEAAATGTTAVKTAETTSFHAATRLSWWVCLIWMSGLLVVITRILRRAFLLRRLELNSLPMNDSRILELLKEEQDKLGVGRKVKLLQSPLALMPMTWGWWRPVILLPREAAKWEVESMRLVIRHELAHAKRGDCLTQVWGQCLEAFYWYNPFVWLAVRGLRQERERACDDLVLISGARPSEYAGLLLDMTRWFSHPSPVAATAMAQPSNLAKRVQSIVGEGRKPAVLGGFSAIMIFLFFFSATLFLFGSKNTLLGADAASPVTDLEQVRSFIASKQTNANELATKAGVKIHADVQAFFAAGIKGDWQTFTNLEWNLRNRSSQYNGKDTTFHDVYWQPALESFLFYDCMAGMTPKFATAIGRDIVDSIPAGSIYFGGTDPGRGLVTGLCKSHAQADPFFTLTQNALADGTYLKYLTLLYGGRIYTPSPEDSQRCFMEYMEDAQQRMKKGQLKPGEDVRMTDGKVQVSGQVAVMSINALLTKIIFDKNPEKQFFVEESFPLDWMMPFLVPHGLIMKLNRTPVKILEKEVMDRDQKYWEERLAPLLGKWLTESTSVGEVTAFAEKVHVRHDFQGFKGDVQFVQNGDACNTYGKLRCSIAGIYVWRANNSSNSAEKQNALKAADYAFRQAYAICPSGPEVVYRYVNLLLKQGKVNDAIQLVQVAHKVADIRDKSHTDQFRQLEEQLKKFAKENQQER